MTAQNELIRLVSYMISTLIRNQRYLLAALLVSAGVVAFVPDHSAEAIPTTSVKIASKSTLHKRLAPAIADPVGIIPLQSLQASNSPLKDQIAKLSLAINHRDLEAIRTQFGASRIYVEIADKAGAYLSGNQALVVIESFLQARSAINSNFEFVSENGTNGSASGSLAARKDGRVVTYKLNFGFTKGGDGRWMLSRVSMR